MSTFSLHISYAIRVEQHSGLSSVLSMVLMYQHAIFNLFTDLQMDVYFLLPCCLIAQE